MFAKIWRFFGFPQPEPKPAQKPGQSLEEPEPYGTPAPGTQAADWVEMRKAAGWQPLQNRSSHR